MNYISSSYNYHAIIVSVIVIMIICQLLPTTTAFMNTYIFPSNTFLPLLLPPPLPTTTTCTRTSTPVSFLRLNQMLGSNDGQDMSSSSSPQPPAPTNMNSLQQVEDFMKERYSIFHNLIMSKNPQVWKELSEIITPTTTLTTTEGESTGSSNGPNSGFTIFVLSDNTMEQNLGTKKLQQLMDERNLETTIKIASYHVATEPITTTEIYNSGGIVTLGGIVDVQRTISGGFFGIVGGKEDGNVTVNNAKLQSTIQFTINAGTTGNKNMVVLHEMDKLISPELLWRYIDQLRIPGSG